jgi:multicomponent Na+:H+ antiporter subunit C
MTFLPYVVATWLLAVGIWGVATSRNYLHLAICVMVAQGSTYVMLLSIGYVHGGKAPLFGDLNPKTVVVDPIVQALTLTDVVVQAVVTALILTLVVQGHRRFASLDPDDMVELSG